MSKIDYDLTKIKAFVFDVDGVLSPSTIPMGADGLPCRMVNIKDGYALQLAVKHGYHIAIITGGYSEALRERFNSLGITDLYMRASEKFPILRQWMTENALLPDEVVYVGDDIPDYDCMKSLPLSVAPRDAAIEIKSVARYISPYDGGHGVGRDVIEQVMKSRGDWMASEKAFGW